MPRSPGRPPLDAHPDARAALLDAAVALYAERGIAATTTADVAARAGVTPALVHYYFRPRERLLDAVVDERVSRFVAHVTARLPGADTPTPAWVAAFADAVFDAAEAMPWMPPLWIREIIAGDGALRMKMARHLPREAIGALAARIAEGQKRGTIDPAIEPRLAFVTLAGATMFPLATQPLWANIAPGAVPTRGDLRRHARAVLAHGLTGPATAAARGGRRAAARATPARSVSG
ncbi:MAG: TetR/AcrR family transcriptional regulator [Proteobacteria bacterium]|nr:TetR/AcrR family transcriptional regulator [Pseudomonadota bacterium]